MDIDATDPTAEKATARVVTATLLSLGFSGGLPPRYRHRQVVMNINFAEAVESV
jgi:hypothetical protein